VAWDDRELFVLSTKFGSRTLSRPVAEVKNFN